MRCNYYLLLLIILLIPFYKKANKKIINCTFNNFLIKEKYTSEVDGNNDIEWLAGQYSQLLFPFSLKVYYQKSTISSFILLKIMNPFVVLNNSTLVTRRTTVQRGSSQYNGCSLWRVILVDPLANCCVNNIYCKSILLFFELLKTKRNYSFQLQSSNPSFAAHQ